jgi:hypothetical protein
MPSVLLLDGGQVGLLSRGRPVRQAEGRLDHKAEDRPDRQARGQVRLLVGDEPKLKAMDSSGL